MAEFEPPTSLPDLGEDIDNETFGQIYDMDEDEDHSFSLQIVEEFFEQAYDTFQEMDDLLKKKDLVNLSERGHYLKGSSATLGLVKVKDSCEQIQRYGKMEDLDGTPVDDKEECHKRLKRSLATCKIECNRAERILKGFYDLPIPDELRDEEDEEPEEEQGEQAEVQGEGEAEVQKEKEEEEEKGGDDDNPKEEDEEVTKDDMGKGKSIAEAKTEENGDKEGDKIDKKTEA